MGMVRAIGQDRLSSVSGRIPWQPPRQIPYVVWPDHETTKVTKQPFCVRIRGSEPVYRSAAQVLLNPNDSTLVRPAATKVNWSGVEAVRRGR